MTIPLLVLMPLAVSGEESDGALETVHYVVDGKIIATADWRTHVGVAEPAWMKSHYGENFQCWVLRDHDPWTTLYYTTFDSTMERLKDLHMNRDMPAVAYFDAKFWNYECTVTVLDPEGNSIKWARMHDGDYLTPNFFPDDGNIYHWDFSQPLSESIVIQGVVDPDAPVEPDEPLPDRPEASEPTSTSFLIVIGAVTIILIALVFFHRRC